MLIFKIDEISSKLVNLWPYGPRNFGLFSSGVKSGLRAKLFSFKIFINFLKIEIFFKNFFEKFTL